MSFIKEFKTFAMRGNVIDMAIGIIIGAAFGKIISSLVTDIIMPPIGLLLGNTDFSNIAFTLKAATEENEAVVIGLGIFFETVINFLIIAFVIFFVVKVMNRMKKKEEEKPAAVPAPSKEELLLTEIRDLLKNDR